MDIVNQTFLVAGLGASGKSAIGLILKRGGKCYVYDDNAEKYKDENVQALLSSGVKLVLKDDVDDVIDKIDVLVLSPGVPLDHEIAVKCKNKGKRIIGELELGYLSAFPAYVCITGTNGKTTTTSMVQEILKQGSRCVHVVGNIGIPITSKCENFNAEDIVVCEVSSFQLETFTSFIPHIAAILNITPDHLSRHYNMDNYIYLKGKILRNLRESEYCVLNAEDATVKQFAGATRAKVVFFSDKQEVDGAYLKYGKICFKGEEILPIDEIPIGGEHNVQNTLASVAISKILGYDNQTIANGIKSFKGVKHRIELVGEKNGVFYINDSKATNIDATIKAIDCINKPIVLILGGKDKGLDYELLFEEIKRKDVIHVVLTGETRFAMLECASRMGYYEVTLSSSFESAVKIASIECPKGGAVLLSPACSSFDCFSGYEERGNRFCEIVEKL